MIFDRNEKKQVVALLGAGSMGTAIVRRIGAGKKILLDSSSLVRQLICTPSPTTSNCNW